MHVHVVVIGMTHSPMTVARRGGVANGESAQFHCRPAGLALVLASLLAIATHTIYWDASVAFLVSDSHMRTVWTRIPPGAARCAEV